MAQIVKNRWTLWCLLPNFGRKKALRYDNQSGIPLPPVDTNRETHHEVYGNAYYSKNGKLPPSMFCIYVHSTASIQLFTVFGLQNYVIL